MYKCVQSMYNADFKINVDFSYQKVETNRAFWNGSEKTLILNTSFLLKNYNELHVMTNIIYGIIYYQRWNGSKKSGSVSDTKKKLDLTY